MTEEHGSPIVRACQAARLSWAAYYKPGTEWAARDAEVIAALQAVVIDEQRRGFRKCHDRLRAQGYGWNHKRTWRVYYQLRLNPPRSIPSMMTARCSSSTVDRSSNSNSMRTCAARCVSP
jgi:putative transposase